MKTLYDRSVSIGGMQILAGAYTREIVAVTSRNTLIAHSSFSDS